MKTATNAIALLMSICLGASMSRADITTGWNVTTQGMHGFLDAANWVGGDVNGVFSENWTPEGWQVLSLANDWTGSLSFLGNIAKDITFRGTDGNRTIRLNGDLVIRPSGSSGKLVFENTVNLDLGGETRRFSMFSPSSSDKFRFNGLITNGNVVVEGNAGISLFNAAAFSGNVKVCKNSTLTINYANDNHIVKRANDVELCRGTFSVNAYSGDDTAQLEELIVTGSDAAGVSVLTIAHNNHVSTLSAKSLAIANGGVLAVLGNDLGVDGSATNRIVFETYPLSPGAADKSGTPSASILKGVVVTVGGNNVLPTKDKANTAYSSMPTLATYGEELGVRALSSLETTNEIPFDGSVNLVIPTASTVNLAGDATINSLQMQANAYNSSSARITGEGTLTVESGMILAIAPKDGAIIDVPLNFGLATGYLVVGGALSGTYETKLQKPVSGAGGLVLTKISATGYDHCIAASSNGRAVTASGASGSTYTGDTYVQCIVDVGSSDLLPHGTRTGNTIVNGSLNFGAIAINGLYGTGLVRGTTLTVGEDGSDSRFAGSAYLTSSLNITNSTFVLDGSVTQGAVNVAAGAAIGGSGGITNNLVFASGAKLAVTVVDGVATCLTVAGTVSGGPVTVNANVRSGKWRTAQRILTSRTSMGEMTFVKGAGVGSLELRNNGTELWATPRKAGFYVVIQ